MKAYVIATTSWDACQILTHKSCILCIVFMFTGYWFCLPAHAVCARTTDNPGPNHVGHQGLELEG